MIYYIKSYSTWLLCEAPNKRKAKSEGVAEYGRGRVREVRPATQDEIDYYNRLHEGPIKAGDRY